MNETIEYGYMSTLIKREKFSKADKDENGYFYSVNEWKMNEDARLYGMLTMMQKVITQGTGQRLIYSYGMKDVDVAGKTGTSNENRDGWFICVTPKLVAGTWVGPEDQTADISKSKAKNGRAVGGSSVALPIMGEFLKRVYEEGKVGISKSDKFVCPEGWQPAVAEESTSSTTTGSGETDEFFE